MLDKINSKIKKSLKAKDKDALITLRMLKSEIIKKNQIKNATKMTDNDIISFIKKTVKKQQETAEIYKQQNRIDLYDEEMNQVKVLTTFLPPEISLDDLTNAVTVFLDNNQITTKQMFGKAMGMCMKEFGSVSDGNTIKSIINEILI